MGHIIKMDILASQYIEAENKSVDFVYFHGGSENV